MYCSTEYQLTSGMELFSYEGKWYLLICDHYSNFSIFRLLPSMSNRNLITALESIISEYGNVEEIMSDNGKKFMTQEYKNFATQYGFKLDTSCPYHPKGHEFIMRQSAFKRQGYARHDAHTKEMPPLFPKQPRWLQKVHNVSLWQPATVISTPGENTPRTYVVSIPDGAKYQQNRLMLQQRVIPDEKLPVPSKASSVSMNAPLIRSELHSSGSDSPQFQNALSTDNDKGDSILSPLLIWCQRRMCLKLMLQAAGTQRTIIR